MRSSRARCRHGSPTVWSHGSPGVALHDFGCTLKAYRRRVLEGVRLYGEMHRFIPIFAAWQGARVTELVVNHRPRTAGRTKYGLGRTFHVILDLILIRFLQRYAQRPLHFFGQFGLWSFGLGMLSFVAMLYFKFIFPWPYLLWARDWHSKDFVETPLPSLTVMFFLAGGMSILLGIQSEVIMRTYYETQDKTHIPARERSARDRCEPPKRAFLNARTIPIRPLGRSSVMRYDHVHPVVHSLDCVLACMNAAFIVELARPRPPR